MAGGRERGRFLVLLRTVHGEGRKDNRDVRKRKRPCVKTGLCCFEAGHLEQEGRWGGSLLAPTRGFLFSALWP